MRASVVAIVLIGAVASTAQPAQAIPIWWLGSAYVWSNNATSTIGVPYTPSLAYQYNSTGHDNSVTRLGTGWYSVRFPLLGPLGTALVTAHGGTSDRCKISHWTGVPGPYLNTTDTVLYVRCYTRTGSPVNSRFTASYTHPDTGEVPRAAHLWNDQPSAPLNTEYTPSLTYQYNSEGDTNTITRVGTGAYLVRLGKLSTGVLIPRQLQVVAHGMPSADPSAYCTMQSSPIDEPPDVLYHVGCFSAAGVGIDSSFVMTYIESGNHILTPVNSYPTAFAGVSCNHQYEVCSLSSNWQFDTNPFGSITLDVLNKGQYAVHLPLSLSGGNVAVTSYWANILVSGRCVIAYWTSAAGVRVNCFDHFGAPAWATFTVSFVST